MALNETELLKRKLCNEPNQYILGKWDFSGRVFIVRKPLLAPRLETNQLVSLGNEFIQKNKEKKLSVLDVGCGTGVIGISLFLDNFREVDSLTVDCLDIDPVAVKTTQENFRNLFKGKNRQAPRFQVHLGDFIEVDFKGKKYDLIASNPPYLSQEDWRKLPKHIKDFENKRALVSWEEGAGLTKALIIKAEELLEEKGVLIIESSPSVLESIQKESLWINGKNGSMEVVQDYFGMSRFGVFYKK